MVEFCNNGELNTQVFAPGVGECINVSTARNIYQLKMTDSLISSLKMSKFDDYELAYITGIIKYPVEEEEAVSEQRVTPMLDYVGRGYHKPVVVGQVKLTEFRRILQTQGYETRFFKGVLIVEGQVVVKRAEEGGIVLEGGLSRVFYEVRTLLYAQLAIL